jgi:hypothetical protein
LDEEMSIYICAGLAQEIGFGLAVCSGNSLLFRIKGAASNAVHLFKKKV